MNIEITPQEELPDADYENCIFCQYRNNILERTNQQAHLSNVLGYVHR